MLAPGFALALAFSFAAWSVQGTPGLMSRPDLALAAYLGSLPFGLASAAIATAIGIAWERARGAVATLAEVSIVLYAGFLKVLGWEWLPWLLVAGVVGCWLLRVRAQPTASPALLATMHVQGLVTGLYLAFHLEDFLAGWPGAVQAAIALRDLALLFLQSS
jgi:hypothetical protein